VSRYQKGKTNLDFTEGDSEWQWHQLGHMQVCTSIQTDNHASTPPLSFLQAGCPSCCPTNSVEALKATASTEAKSKNDDKAQTIFRLTCSVSRAAADGDERPSTSPWPGVAGVDPSTLTPAGWPASSSFTGATYVNSPLSSAACISATGSRSWFG